MKRLSLFKRPRYKELILEVGCGHNPYAGITHAVDKFPDDNSQRASHLSIPEGVLFKQGDLESIPFETPPQFNFIYVSHVFEHVNNAEKAISEINRIAKQGYFETPSPLREQISSYCNTETQVGQDFHTLFCWADKKTNTIHAIPKSKKSIGQFCKCNFGKTASILCQLNQNPALTLEALLPRSSKTTELLFKTPLRIQIHTNFEAACQQGKCAYQSVDEIFRWTSFPRYFGSKRFRQLRRLIKKNSASAKSNSGQMDHI